MPEKGKAKYSLRRENLVLAALWAANFMIGLGMLAPAGIINDLSAAFHVSVPRAASLIGYGALILCIEAPLFAFLTNKIERHVLLAGSMSLYTIGHLVSVFITDFDTLLAVRIFTVTSAAILTPQASSAVQLFVHPERRAVAITLIMTGWTTSFAVGLPLASLVAAHLGWQLVYVFLGVGSFFAALAIWYTMPRRLYSPRLSVAAWKVVFTSPKVLIVVAVSSILLMGHFTSYPFIAADLKMSFKASPEMIAIVLTLYGLAGLTGSLLSTRLIGRIGPHRSVTIFVSLMIVAMIIWSLGHYSVMLLIPCAMFWGFSFSPTGSAQQARLVYNAPELASASIALNTALLYMGQSIGTFIGAFILQHYSSRYLGLAGASIVSVALLLSLYGHRRWAI